ncbi:MAG: hypothetical protein EBY84_05825, partial [Acidimicrobiia bacterium]|nr:hypothetical protein [Acidimicrobiia bacterium]
VFSFVLAILAWAVVPFGPDVALANINVGLLFVMAITSMEVYGVVIGCSVVCFNANRATIDNIVKDFRLSS